MIQHIKTALMGESSRTDTAESVESGGVAATDGSAVATDSPTAAADDIDDAPAVGQVDPFRPEFDFEDAPPRGEVDMDQIFSVLGNSRRRYALKYLSMESDVVTMSDLAEQVAAWECNKSLEQISSKERKRVYVSLYQSHLPKMADAAAIEYDKDRGTIECGERFEQFSHYLRNGD